MSFDIHLHTCDLGKKKKKIKNRFTGKTMEAFEDDGLTEDERVAVTDLLTGVKAKGPDEQGCYVVKFRDGGAAEVLIDNLDGSAKCEGCMLAIRASTPKLVEFVYDLARVGNMLMTPVMEDPVTLVTSPDQQNKIRTRWPEAVVIGSAKELKIFLDKGVKAWQEYRDGVVHS